MVGTNTTGWAAGIGPQCRRLEDLGTPAGARRVGGQALRGVVLGDWVQPRRQQVLHQQKPLSRQGPPWLCDCQSEGGTPRDPGW